MTRVFRFSVAAVFGFLSVSLLPDDASAESECSNAWFMRNLIAHRGGHCFTSNLGKGMFGNEGCRKGGATLSETQREQMASIKQMERDWRCNVDTNQRTIYVENRKLLEKLKVFPVRDDTESGCLNYLAEDIPLRAAPSTGAEVIGQISRGVNVGDSHLPRDGWSYAEVYRNSEMVATGWYNTDIWRDKCENYAG